MKIERERRRSVCRRRHFIKTRTAGILRRFDTVTFVQLKDILTCSFRGHRDPAHDVRWRDIYTLSSEASHRERVKCRPHNETGERRRGAKCKRREAGAAASTAAFLFLCALEPANGC